MNLWLDDVRPAPEGWVWVKTVHDVQKLLLQGKVEKMSLDHDLGPQPLCHSCDGETQDCGQCHCHNRHSDGTDLVNWMVGANKWPLHKPLVHSQNPEGAKHMRQMIDRYYPHETLPHEGNGGLLSPTTTP
jgi:hypothetical protein